MSMEFIPYGMVAILSAVVGIWLSYTIYSSVGWITFFSSLGLFFIIEKTQYFIGTVMLLCALAVLVVTIIVFKKDSTKELSKG